MNKTIHNKVELLDAINKIPKFTKRDIFVQDEAQNYIQEKRLIAITEENTEAKYEIITTISKWYKLIQFENVFAPIVNHFQDVEGELSYYFGAGVMGLFPKGDEFKTEDGHKIGLVITNSVNTCLAINVNFCILVNNKRVYLPNKIGIFRRLHIGKKVEQIATDYERFLGDIKDSWKIVVSKFDRALTQDDVDNVIRELKLGARYSKKIRETFKVIEGANLKLWDLFMEIVEVYSEREYKKEENRITNMKKISNVLYSYALMEII